MNEIIEITAFGEKYPQGIGKLGGMFEDRGNGWEPKPKSDLQIATEELDAYLAGPR